VRNLFFFTRQRSEISILVFFPRLFSLDDAGRKGPWSYSFSFGGQHGCIPPSFLTARGPVLASTRPSFFPPVETSALFFFSFGRRKMGLPGWCYILTRRFEPRGAAPFFLSRARAPTHSFSRALGVKRPLFPPFFFWIGSVSLLTSLLFPPLPSVGKLN